MLVMTIENWINDSLQKLKKTSVDSPRSDVFAILENITGKDRTWIVAHSEHSLSESDLKKLNNLIERRVRREPLAYILGKVWFYGRVFKVTPDVLIPRPESEDFIDILKDIKPSSLADIGTGSGCLAISAKLELPECQVTAVDISQAALKIAWQNAKDHKTDISFLNGSLFEPIKTESEAIVANLPYVPEDFIASPEIETEPRQAWSAGEDGLEVYKKFWQEVNKLKQKPKYILTESLLDQHQEVKMLANKAAYNLEKTEGLVQLFKI